MYLYTLCFGNDHIVITAMDEDDFSFIPSLFGMIMTCKDMSMLWKYGFFKL